MVKNDTKEPKQRTICKVIAHTPINVRSRPYGPIIAELMPNDIVEVWSTVLDQYSENWAMVLLTDKVGFVMASYLKAVKKNG